MYYPKQIPYLLDKEFQDNITYKEYHIEELNDYCMCIWKMCSKKDLNKPIYNYVLPDACIDIVIDFTNQTICFAGFSKNTELLELHGKVDYIGVRLKPGAFYTLYEINAEAIMDRQIAFSTIDSTSNIQKILKHTSTNERLHILKNYLVEKIKDKPNKKVIDFIEQLYQMPSEQNVMMIAETYGYHKRHLLRIFKRNYGVSTKVLLNILRLHLCLTLLLEENKSLIEIATLCGFYDQSHFIKEIKRYTGISPIKLLENYK